MEPEPTNTFRGLPLTSEQDSEIRHYIHIRQRGGLPWDTPELHAMLSDMLDPPEADEEDRRSIAGSIDKEREAAVLDGETGRDKANPR
jgi:hypothetical protein